MKHVKSVILIAGVILCGACHSSRSLADVPAARDSKQRVTEYHDVYAKRSAAISPIKDGWAVAVEMRSAGKKLAFTRDVPITAHIVLYDLRLVARPTDFTDSDRFAVVKICTPDGTQMARVHTSSDAIGWSDGPQNWSTWSATAKIELRNIMAALPDGTYDLICEWPAGKGRAEISCRPLRIVVADVTAEQAREAAALDSKAAIVTLSAQPDGATGTLTNHSTRPIYFAASVGGDSMLGSTVVNADDKTWRTLNASSVYTPAGWTDLDLGYCGNGVGRVVVAPGKSAKVAMYPPQASGRFVRLSVSWFYFDQPAKQYAGGTATTDVVELR